MLFRPVIKMKITNKVFYILDSACKSIEINTNLELENKLLQV